MNSPPDPSEVWATLRSIPDPEFGINIVDLGLIYSVECNAGDIAVTMTLTTPTCPSGGWIFEGVRQAIAALPGAHRVDVALVFEPAWTNAMLSDSALRQLGAID